MCQSQSADRKVKNLEAREITLAFGKLTLCWIEKTASSFMKTLRAKESDVLKDYKKKHLTERPTQNPNNAKKLVIVREPYGRLVSAYIDKLYTRAIWWKTYGQIIVSHFRYVPTDEQINCGSDVTFTEFVRYVIYTVETGRFTEPHFDPINKHCQFCTANYDYYVHLETLVSDMEYIYKSVNETLRYEMSDDEFTMGEKMYDFIVQREEGKYKNCETTCGLLDRAWWSFHARGLIAKDVKMPLKGQICDTIKQRDLSDVAWKAHQESKDTFSKKRQRRDKIVELFMQVPLLDRLKLRDIFMNDFMLHGYDSTPVDLFPEVYQNS